MRLPEAGNSQKTGTVRGREPHIPEVLDIKPNLKNSQVAVTKISKRLGSISGQKLLEAIGFLLTEVSQRL
ncbi:hypothetical protein J6590_087759 [Homalodisca vitripennis]|nr:hypothetical protein J6590_087759 [Homalodisca vitripennis]